MFKYSNAVYTKIFVIDFTLNSINQLSTDNGTRWCKLKLNEYQNCPSKPERQTQRVPILVLKTCKMNAFEKLGDTNHVTTKHPICTEVYPSHQWTPKRTVWSYIYIIIWCGIRVCTVVGIVTWKTKTIRAATCNNACRTSRTMII